MRYYPYLILQHLVIRIDQYKDRKIFFFHKNQQQSIALQQHSTLRMGNLFDLLFVNLKALFAKETLRSLYKKINYLVHHLL